MRTVGPVIRRRNDDANGALIGYLPVGFPTLDQSVEAAVALVENGVDVLELGLPYSDPVMDGPVIQAATQQALANGFRLTHGFEAVRRITERTDAPVLIMTYWNPVVQYGVDRFADDLAAAGGAGLITPDLIPDEAADWIAASERTGLDRVFLAAPSSTDARVRQERAPHGSSATGSASTAHVALCICSSATRRRQLPHWFWLQGFRLPAEPLRQSVKDTQDGAP